MKEFKPVTGAVLMVVTNTEQDYHFNVSGFSDIKRLEIVAEGEKAEMIAMAGVLKEREYFAGKWHYYLVLPAYYAKAMVAKYQ